MHASIGLTMLTVSAAYGGVTERMSVKRSGAGLIKQCIRIQTNPKSDR